MSIENQYRSILKAVTEYEDLLGRISEEDFLKSPADGGWSYSETYSHIFKANSGSLIAAEKCILKTGVYSRNRILWLPWIILFAGRFPPVKIKAPSGIAALTEKISREKASNMIVKFKSRLADIKPRIHTADPCQKVKHPRLGLLNARQWFRFIEVHTVHHTKQLKRIQVRIA